MVGILSPWKLILISLDVAARYVNGWWSKSTNPMSTQQINRRKLVEHHYML